MGSSDFTSRQQWLAVPQLREEPGSGGGCVFNFLKAFSAAEALDRSGINLDNCRRFAKVKQDTIYQNVLFSQISQVLLD